MLKMLNAKMLGSHRRAAAGRVNGAAGRTRWPATDVETPTTIDDPIRRQSFSRRTQTQTVGTQSATVTTLES